MQQTTGVAILATHLAITDRRALSQAWYSALHVAEHAPAAAVPRARVARGTPQSAAVRPAPVARGAAGRGAVAPNGAQLHRATSARCNGPAAFAPERRAPQTELARRIERGLARRVRGAPASFAVSVAGGRVQLLVRSDGARTRVVAVCAPNVRERVDRALAHARFALAAAGLRTEPA